MTDDVFDFTRPDVFKKVAALVKAGKVKWLHLAPPCATFSRARKDGLRAPWGSRARKKLHMKLGQADILARNTFKLASLKLRAGGFVSIENPEHSLIWRLKAAQDFLKLQGCRPVAIDYKGATLSASRKGHMADNAMHGNVMRVLLPQVLQSLAFSLSPLVRPSLLLPLCDAEPLGNIVHAPRCH